MVHNPFNDLKAEEIDMLIPPPTLTKRELLEALKDFEDSDRVVVTVPGFGGRLTIQRVERLSTWLLQVPDEIVLVVETKGSP